jgi:hypothetical protein
MTGLCLINFSTTHDESVRFDEKEIDLVLKNVMLPLRNSIILYLKNNKA